MATHACVSSPAKISSDLKNCEHFFVFCKKKKEGREVYYSQYIIINSLIGAVLPFKFLQVGRSFWQKTLKGNGGYPPP